MRLPEYIELVGDEAAAELFRAPARTVLSWRLMERYPRPNKARDIERLTLGKVTVGEIYAEQKAGA